MPPPSLDLFAVCAPGLEPVLAAELEALGAPGRAVPGGVELAGDLSLAARLNLWLRSASRVLVRLGTLHATSFPELVSRARTLPFERALPSGLAVALRVTCRKSRLYHSGAVAERLHAAIEARLKRAVPRVESRAESEDDSPDELPRAQLLLARFDHDLCTVSADTSGALLHRRGYRASPGRAPLRETLAAALLLAGGYRGHEPFVDPLCGSGTLAIEAALLARRRAPGLHRTFAIERWPDHDRSAFDRSREEARAGELAGAPAPVHASDADPVAVAAARANAARAGVDLVLEHRPLSALQAPAPRGLCAVNPPYGRRVDAARGEVPQLWRELGEVARTRLRGWTLSAVCPDLRLARLANLPFRTLLRTRNGGLPIEMLQAEVP